MGMSPEPHRLPSVVTREGHYLKSLGDVSLLEMDVSGGGLRGFQKPRPVPVCLSCWCLQTQMRYFYISMHSTPGTGMGLCAYSLLVAEQTAPLQPSVGLIVRTFKIQSSFLTQGHRLIFYPQVAINSQDFR